MNKKCEPKIVKSVLLGNYYYTDDYEDLGNGNLICNSKRKATEEEINQFVNPKEASE